MTLSDYLARQKTDAQLMSELYADGMTIKDIAEKFDTSPQLASYTVKKFGPTSDQVDRFKRNAVRKNLNKHYRNRI